MLNLGMSAAERRAFNDALVSTHKVRVRATLMTLEHEPLSKIDDGIEDGQITVDQKADISRQASLTIFDPRGSFPLDSGSPADGALFMDRMIRVWRDIKPPGQDWINVPVFTGPITMLIRSGDYITVEGSGKEILSQGHAFYPETYGKKRLKVNVIEDIMRDYAGETRFDLRDHKGRLPKSVSLKRDSIPWDVAQRIAASMGLQLFYDARGVLRLRKRPGNVQWTFTGGNGGEIMSEPEVTYSLSDGFANAVWVKGGSRKLRAKPPRKGEDREDEDDVDEVEDDPDTPWDETTEHPPVHFLLTADRSHPLSPWSLGANGKPRFYLHVIDNDKIKTKAEAREAAREALDRKLDQALSASFDSLVIPHLEVGDLARVATDDISVHFRADEFAIPLAPDQPMTVGYSRNLTPKRRGKKGKH